MFDSLKGAFTRAAASSDAALPDLLLSSGDVGSTSSSTSSILQHPVTPPLVLTEERMQTTSPIDIATSSRNTSSSPSSQGQTTAKYHGIEDSKTSAMMTSGGLDPNMGRKDSFARAKPISMNNPNRNEDGRPRRESLAGSLVGGMSWGGVSVGSWVRDDIIMTGTSPFPYQSPSFHSSSYLPKLEANFMRDFSCCGATLPTLHDLLHHYEECHAQQTPQTRASSAQQARNGNQPDSKAAHAAKVANTLQQQAQQQQQQQLQGSQTTPIRTGQPAGGQSALTGGIQRMLQQQQSQPSTPVQQMAQPVPIATEDMEGVEDMEMDDAIGPMESVSETTPLSGQRPAQTQQSRFGQPQRPNLHLTNTNGMIHQGLRSSQPNTPSATAFGFQNNPTVSSVNTPTLSTHSIQQNQYQNDDSIPGTPDLPDDDFNQMAMNMNLGNMNLNNMSGMGNLNFGNFGNFGLANAMNPEMCIDDPAKRLFSPNGFGSQRALQQQFNSSFGAVNGQMGMGQLDQETLRQLRQAQMLQNMQMQAMAGGNMAMMGEENKPFKCPVMGCEKAYKNQNGLKYHKTHGHQNQQLHENGDGTFSIVNPETSAPYPGTLGMEKEKPYKCEVCGKRYKNLNGLKYHKSHSPPCNPELKLNSHMQAVGLVGLGLNNGLPGIGEEM